MAVLLPYDCLKEFLEAHPLVATANVQPETIHACMLTMMREDSDESRPSPSKTSNKAQKAKPAPNMWRCTHCKARMTVDIRESELVCTACGVVSRWINPDNCRVFEESKVVRTSAATSTIPRWVKAANDFDPGEYHRIEVERAIDHWNTYRPGGTHHSVDALPRLKDLAMRPTRASDDTRAVAA